MDVLVNLLVGRDCGSQALDEILIFMEKWVYCREAALALCNVLHAIPFRWRKEGKSSQALRNPAAFAPETMKGSRV